MTYNRNAKRKVLTITGTGCYGEKAQQERQETFDKVKNFLELLKVDFTSDYVDYQTMQFVLNIDDYEYVLILQCLRLSDIYFEFE